MNKTLMIVGVGDLTGLVLDMITRVEGIGKIVLASRNISHMNQRKNLSLLAAIQLGFFPEIECVEMDLNNIEQSAETISTLRPDVIFNTATLQSWRIITYLPQPVFAELDEAQFGPWLPMHLTLVHKLMKGVMASGVETTVINAAFPDAVGPVLDRVGLAPHSGIGNVANVIPAFKAAIAAQLSVSKSSIDLSLYTQHYFSHRVPAYGDSGGSPYHLEVFCQGQEVSSDIDHERLLTSIRTDFKKTGGAFRQMITAASACSVLIPLLTDQEAKIHAPAIQGLPGGYAGAISSGKFSVIEPTNVSLQEAIVLNEKCQQFDGIKHIAADGTVHFTENEMAIMTRMIGYHCGSMKLDESEQWATELGRKFNEFAQQYR